MRHFNYLNIFIRRRTTKHSSEQTDIENCTKVSENEKTIGKDKAFLKASEKGQAQTNNIVL